MRLDTQQVGDARWCCGLQGHYLLGLRILHMLVAEFNQPTAGRTMTLHRKLAVAFRDASLFKVFQVAIAAMQQLQSNASADEKLREQVDPAHLLSMTHSQAWTEVGCSVCACHVASI